MPGWGPYKETTTTGKLRYYAIKEDASGKRERFTHAKKSVVRRWLAEDALDLAEGTYRTASKVTLKTYVREWKAIHRDSYRVSTWRDYCSVLTKWILPALGFLRFDQIDTAAVNLAVRKPMIRAGLSSRRQQIVTTVLNLIMQEAVADGLIRANPVEALPSPSTRGEWKSEPAYVEPDEIFRRLFDTSPFRDLPAVALGVLAGLRSSEVWGMPRQAAVAAIDSGVLEVKQKLVWTPGKEFDSDFLLEPPKGRLARREVAICRELRAILEAWAEEAAPNDYGLFFIGGTGKPIRHDNWRRRRFAPIRELGKLDTLGLRYHDLRHCFAMLRIFEGADMLSVQRDLGHSSITTTERYARLRWDPRANRATPISAQVFGDVDDFTAWLNGRKTEGIAKKRISEEIGTYKPKSLRILKKCRSA